MTRNMKSAGEYETAQKFTEMLSFLSLLSWGGGIANLLLFDRTFISLHLEIWVSINLLTILSYQKTDSFQWLNKLVIQVIYCS